MNAREVLEAETTYDGVGNQHKCRVASSVATAVSVICPQREQLCRRISPLARSMQVKKLQPLRVEDSGRLFADWTYVKNNPLRNKTLVARLVRSATTCSEWYLRIPVVDLCAICGGDGVRSARAMHWRIYCKKTCVKVLLLIFVV